jgi:hypothetical protein
MDPSQRECRRCGLFLHRQSSQIPEDGLFAWRIHEELSSPAVKRFQLQEPLLRSLDLDLDQDEFRELVYFMNAIEEGIIRYYEEKPKPKT